MEPIMIASTILITLALVFYSLGVWAERLSRFLKPWHVAAFWTGFAFDVSGTLGMHQISDGPFDLQEPHTLTGQIALWLMFAHAIWASRVIRKGSEKELRGFHRYSLVVWIIWLIPKSILNCTRRVCTTRCPGILRHMTSGSHFGYLYFSDFILVHRFCRHHNPW